MTLRDFLGSVLRTGVPALVGLGLAALAAKFGIVIDDTVSTQIANGFAVLIGTAYYALIRVAEAKWKWVGWLLGWNVPPTYDKAV